MHASDVPVKISLASTASSEQAACNALCAERVHGSRWCRPRSCVVPDQSSVLSAAHLDSGLEWVLKMVPDWILATVLAAGVGGDR